MIESLLATMQEYTIEPERLIGKKYQSIKILDAKELNFKDFKGIKIKELSALAYKDNTLYILGDKGSLFHFDIRLKNDKIQSLDISNAFVLKDKYGEKLKKKHRDSEGLCFLGKNLLISFEGKPRVNLYTLSGIKIKNKKIHQDIRKIKKYRSGNKALESVAYNDTYEILTAPEKPLTGLDKRQHTLYSKTKKWTLPASGSITALEFMSENEIMILERNLDILNFRIVISLSSLNLKTLKYKVLAKLDSRDGWNLDNFEGLTKVDGNKYLMISDDNDSFFQKTLLVLFEVED